MSRVIVELQQSFTNQLDAFNGSRVFTSSYPLIPCRGIKLQMSHCYQGSGFPYLCNDEARCHHWSPSPHLIPPVRHYQTDVNIKEEPIYKSVFVLGNRLRFQGGHKRRWCGPRTTHLTRSSLPQGLSVHHCHKRAFLPSTSCRYCSSLLPEPPVLEYLRSLAQILRRFRVLMSLGEENSWSPMLQKEQ